MNVPYTCPLIDEIIDDLKMHRSMSSATPSYYISICRMDIIIGKLEELREMNKSLRYDASFWKQLYEHALLGDFDFNPEVLPKE